MYSKNCRTNYIEIKQLQIADDIHESILMFLG